MRPARFYFSLNLQYSKEFLLLEMPGNTDRYDNFKSGYVAIVGAANPRCSTAYWVKRFPSPPRSPRPHATAFWVLYTALTPRSYSSIRRESLKPQTPLICALSIQPCLLSRMRISFFLCWMWPTRIQPPNISWSNDFT